MIGPRRAYPPNERAPGATHGRPPWGGRAGAPRAWAGFRQHGGPGAADPLTARSMEGIPMPWWQWLALPFALLASLLVEDG